MNGDIYGSYAPRPLQSRGREQRSIHTRQSSSRSHTVSVRSHSQMSPPLTPQRSRETIPPPSESEVTFHNYLRAFYPFHPSSTVSSTSDQDSITVPINQGDVILVHSIHPNGWADGTLLGSGARGWLPTNYCEAYDPASLRNLLNALTHLWDLVRSGDHENLIVFTRQDYVRGMIAGVRYFLVSWRLPNIDRTFRKPYIKRFIGNHGLFVERVSTHRKPRWIAALAQTPFGRFVHPRKNCQTASRDSSNPANNTVRI